MINITNSTVVFAVSGTDLHVEICNAMLAAAEAVLEREGCRGIDLQTVSTLNKKEAAYAKFVITWTLMQPVTFDEAYVQLAYEVTQATIQNVTDEQWHKLLLASPQATYKPHLKRGTIFFLLFLHCKRVITLPMTFNWPYALLTGPHGSVSPGSFSELLEFLQLLDPAVAELPHPAFRWVGATRKRKEWFLTYGVRLLLATGWQQPSDASMGDLLAIQRADSELEGSRNAYKALIGVFSERFGEAFPVTMDGWTEVMKSRALSGLRAAKRAGIGPSSPGAKGSLDPLNDDALLELVKKATPAMAHPELLKCLQRLPGLDVALPDLTAKWVALEELYQQTLRLESDKGARRAIGYLNIYLFYYLPLWFQRNQDSALTFPKTPSQLIGSVFISRLLKPTTRAPRTFLEVMDLIHQTRKWNNNAYYATLKQVEQFFEFLERHADDLPECMGFRQPIPDYAYPATYGGRGTSKRPIPRRMFGLFLDYVEALRAHSQVVLEKILSGSLDSSELEEAIRRTGNVIDTLATAPLVGFVPIVFARGRTIPLVYIPECLSLGPFTLVDGRRLKIPRPHGLSQTLIALYTGLRNNHIQWLDARNFDAHVVSDDKDFARLNVNTDKQKRTPWAPHVNFRVIEVLRSQLAWRNLVNEPRFNQLQHYNNNEKTKWPPILPLFAYGEDGRPHADSVYENVWHDILCAVEGLRCELGDASVQRLCALEPPGVAFDHPAPMEMRREYGQAREKVCYLRVKTGITPHSARVTVVSQYSTLIPAEVIGANITGQSPGVVYYYVKLEADQLSAEQARQAMALRERAYRSEFEAIVGGGPRPSPFIKAEDVNSNFARSLRSNLQETIISYGCVSITMNEDATSGLDVLRETRGINAAENKTEVCPYGNHCPPEVIAQWKGPRRCGLCQYAVRSIDHLPAVAAKVREMNEVLQALTARLEAAIKEGKSSRYTDAELDRLDEERCRIAEELAGWHLSEEVLNAARSRIAEGHDSRRWIVQKPEIILQDLQQVAAPSNLTSYVLARLGECIAFPSMESPQIRARFDLLRREILVRSGRMKEALDSVIPVDPSAELVGLLRTVIDANRLTYDDLLRILNSDAHIAALPAPAPRLLANGD